MTQKLGLVECTNDEYHAADGYSKSHLDVVERSPRHYWGAYIDPDREPRVPTPAMVQGTAIHAAILEPDEFSARFVVPPDINRRTNAGKAEYADWCAEVEGCTILTHEQHDIALAVRDSVFRNKAARDLLQHGQAEASYFALDPDTGELVKCRTDWFNGHADCIVDVKSTEDASPDGFMRSVASYRYFVQVPWYRDVMEAALDTMPPTDWVFLAVEKSPPYAVGLYRLPDVLIKAGRVIARVNLLRILHCKMLDDWPEYNDGQVVQLVPPSWLSRRFMSSPEVDFA